MSLAQCCETDDKEDPIAKRPRPENSKKDVLLTYSVSVERIRFIAFVCFWFMCIFAMVMTQLFVRPMMLEGPLDGSTCPPYERNNPELGVTPGKGFDSLTQSHLVDTFKANNICVNWDYSPSRELTSIIYPAFEYSLALYFIFDYIQILLTNLRGELHPWFFTFAQIAFPINLFLVSQFRQIFVNLAYVNVRAHTAGYLGLQICLFSVTFQNSLFVLQTGASYNLFWDKCGGPAKRRRNTRYFLIFYLICQTIVTFFNAGLAVCVVVHGEVPGFYYTQVLPNMNFMAVLGKFYLLFNAIMPLFISWRRSKADHPLEIVIKQRVQYDGHDEETEPLK